MIRFAGSIYRSGIQRGFRTFLPASALCLVVGAAPVFAAGGETQPKADEAPKTMVLKHDDGAGEGKQSLGGSGHAVFFDCPSGQWLLTEVNVFGSRYGSPQAPNESATLTLLDHELKQIAQFREPYATFERGDPKWHKIAVPATAVPQQFVVCVDFNPGATKGVYVHRDDSSGGHSAQGLPGQGFTQMAEGEWMIRATIAPGAAGAAAPAKTPAVSSAAMLQYGDGTSDGKKSMAGSGHIVQFETGPGEWEITRVDLYGSRYGSSQAPREDFTISLTDRNGNEIASWKKPYHLFTRGNPQWRMLPVTPAAVPGKFSICFNFNPTATKGVYVHLDNSTKGHSADGLPGRKPRKRDDGDWMIRVVVRKAKTPAP